MLAPNTYEGALKSEDVRRLCYQLAAEAHLASAAVRQMDDFEMNETLLAIDRQLSRWEDVLNGVAGGSTFDRFGKLEEGKAVQS